MQGKLLNSRKIANSNFFESLGVCFPKRSLGTPFVVSILNDGYLNVTGDIASFVCLSKILLVSCGSAFF